MSDNIQDHLPIGDYVIVRSYNEGVNAGFLEAAGIGFCVLKEARRLWRHKPSVSSVCWYEGVATFGLSEDSQVSPPVRKTIVEDYSITVCNAIGKKSIRKHPNHVQS